MNSTNFTTNATLAGYFATNEEANLFGFSKSAKKAADEMKLFSANAKFLQSHFHSVCSQQQQLLDERQSKEMILMSGRKRDIQNWKQNIKV